MRTYLSFIFLLIVSQVVLWAEPTKVWVREDSYRDYGFIGELKETLGRYGFDVENDPSRRTWDISVVQQNMDGKTVSFIANIFDAMTYDYRRMLLYSLPRETWFQMREAARKDYLRKVTIHFTRQLQVECDDRKGEKLKVGFLVNRVNSDLLDMKFEEPKPARIMAQPRMSDAEKASQKAVASQKPSRTLELDVIGSKPPVPSNNADSTQSMSLPPQVLPELSYELEEPTKKESTKSEPVTEIPETQYEFSEVDMVALSEKFESLESRLKGELPATEKATVMVEQAKAYVQIGDTDEAMLIVDKALALDGKNGEALALKKFLTPPPLPLLERIRSAYKKHRLSSSVRLALEQDSNIILEQKDPLNPTNKDDTIMSLSLGLNHNLNKEHTIGLQIFANSHFENDNLNMWANTVSYLWARKLSNQLTVMTPVSLSYYAIDSKSLLWNSNFSGMGIYEVNEDVSVSGELGYLSSSYFQTANQSFESKQWRLKFGMDHRMPSFKNHRIKAYLSWQDEDAKSDVISYEQMKFGLGYHVALSYPWLNSFNTGIAFQNRDYKGAAAGVAKRMDDRWEWDFGLGKTFKSGHQVGVQAVWMSNDSNLNVSSYEKYKGSLFWRLAL